MARKPTPEQFLAGLLALWHPTQAKPEDMTPEAWIEWTTPAFTPSTTIREVPTLSAQEVWDMYHKEEQDGN